MKIEPGKHHTPTGADLLHNPHLQKGTAFTKEERGALGLRGLLPPHVSTQELQIKRILENFHTRPEELPRYIYLTALQDRNETLFYRVLIENLEEMMPVIYTPTVGKACQEYGLIFQRPRGLFISAEDRGHVAGILRNWPSDNVRVIVVTDGERILGLGDLGLNGMGIPVGKLSLYTACAGVHPSFCLPILLDVGTNNNDLLSDPFYLGLKQRRLTGQEYDELVEELVSAVQEVYPHAMVQWEDFATANALRVLKTYRDRICTFNDDIQGTAAVALAGIYSALRITGGALGDQKLLFLGAGEAGIGIGDLMVSAMVAEGMDEASARARCWYVDSKGLVVKSRGGLAEHKKAFAHDHEPLPDLESAVKALKPTGIIGVSGQAGAFSREVVEAMAATNGRPIIFALSNPTSKAECTAEEAYTWSKGTAVFASGSPFAPVVFEGRTYVPGQGNNAYIFPGVGLGVIVSEARHITDEMFFVAAKTLASKVSEEDLKQGRIYPALSKVRDVSAAIAAAVAEVVFERNLASVLRPDDLPGAIREQMYDARYEPLV